MEIILLDYFATFAHAFLSAVLWLAVIVGTAAVLVYNRITHEVAHALHLDEDHDEGDRRQ